MAEIRLYYADCAGVPGNCSYPHEAVIEDAASLRRAVSRDYVCVAYKNSYRANAALFRIPRLPYISAGTT